MTKNDKIKMAIAENRTNISNPPNRQTVKPSSAKIISI